MKFLLRLMKAFKESHPSGVRPEDEAWIKAHPAIRRAAYGVLILITLASAFLSIARGSMGPAIISIVVVISLCLVVLGLVWIAERKEWLWQLVGGVLVTAVLAGIVTLFLAILVYIGTGYPAWLDVWFGPAVQVDAPEGVGVGGADDIIKAKDPRPGMTLASTSAGSKETPPRNVIRHDDGSFEVLTESKGDSVREEPTSQGIGLKRARRSSQMIAPIATYERQITWSKSAYEDVTIEVEVTGRGGDKYQVTVQEPSQSGSARFTGLLSNEMYDYKVTAIRKGRRSPTVNGCFATPLDFYVDDPQPHFPGFITYYSAERDCDGKIEADDGTIIYEALQYWEEKPKRSNGVARWIYVGEIRDSLPTWNGTLHADPIDCLGDACGSTCTLSKGIGDCELFLDFVAVSRSDGKNALYGPAKSQYRGSIIVSESGDRRLGPVRYSFKIGDLEAVDRDYSDVYSGDWEHNDIAVIKNATFADLNSFRTGALLSGKEVVESDCLVAVFPHDPVVGAGFRGTCGSFEVGEFRGKQDPFNGFRLDLSEGSPVRLFRNGVTTVLSPPSGLDAASCFKSHQFDINASTEWPLACEGGGSRLCNIRSKKVDVEFQISAAEGKLPSVQFLHTETAGKDNSVLVDGTRFAFAPRSSKDAPLSSLAMMAQFCSGKELKTNYYEDTVPLTDFCPTAAVAFARLVTCK
ncbi:hypothetical protein [Sinorhizobium meliloti]|uniref:fibronectin type III domain-containing protein n=1 Tax=Rhizobium meliloti TaxID=382 RepID=UPI0030CAEA34